MVIDLAKIERLERELEKAKAQLWREDAERYRILMREISKEEKDRIVGNLTDKGERVLFGLEAPEEGAAMRPGSSGGDLSCPICGKSGLAKRAWGCIPYACMARRQGKRKVRRRETWFEEPRWTGRHTC